MKYILYLLIIIPIIKSENEIIFKISKKELEDMFNSRIWEIIKYFNQVNKNLKIQMIYPKLEITKEERDSKDNEYKYEFWISFKDLKILQDTNIKTNFCGKSGTKFLIVLKKKEENNDYLIESVYMTKFNGSKRINTQKFMNLVGKKFIIKLNKKEILQKFPFAIKGIDYYINLNKINFEHNPNDKNNFFMNFGLNFKNEKVTIIKEEVSKSNFTKFFKMIGDFILKHLDSIVC